MNKTKYRVIQYYSNNVLMVGEYSKLYEAEANRAISGSGQQFLTRFRAQSMKALAAHYLRWFSDLLQFPNLFRSPTQGNGASASKIERDCDSDHGPAQILATAPQIEENRARPVRSQDAAGGGTSRCTLRSKEFD